MTSNTTPSEEPFVAVAQVADAGFTTPSELLRASHVERLLRKPPRRRRQRMERHLDAFKFVRPTGAGQEGFRQGGKVRPPFLRALGRIGFHVHNVSHGHQPVSETRQ